jgi:hypothetical protein
MIKSGDRLRRSRSVLLVLLAVSASSLAAATTVGAAPSGRAYELVSPADKGGNDVAAGTMRATPAGDAIAFGASDAFADAPTSLLGGTDVSLVESSAALTPGAVEGDSNVYLRDNRTGALTFVGTSPDRLFNQLFIFLGSPVIGASTDLKHIVFAPTRRCSPTRSRADPTAMRS